MSKSNWMEKITLTILDTLCSWHGQPKPITRPEGSERAASKTWNAKNFWKELRFWQVNQYQWQSKWLSYVVACKSPLCFAQWSIGQGYQYGSLLLTTLVPDYVRDQQLVIEAILQQMGPAMCWRRAPMEVSSHVHKDAPRHFTVSIGSQTVWAWRVRCEPVDGSFQKRWLRGCICKAGIGWSHLISMLNLAILQWCSCQFQRQQATCSKSTSGGLHCTPQS